MFNCTLNIFEENIVLEIEIEIIGFIWLNDDNNTYKDIKYICISKLFIENLNDKRQII